ncbi:PRC-barrel domain-containing protein [Microvirga sp. GCM10011540]|uniref:PRC-barrel domain-containing protein n=1 Tax=Microvirga sp. GCM10011540 TaxID=3317338 RepID=UPI00360DCA65
MQKIHHKVLLGLLLSAPLAAMAQNATPQRVSPQTQVNQGTPDPASTAALPFRTMRAGELEGSGVYNARGEKLGEVKRLVFKSTDGRRFIVLDRGGFLGVAEKEVPIRLDQVFYQQGRLVVRDVTGPELEAVPDWDVRDHEYRELVDSDIVNIPQL